MTLVTAAIAVEVDDRIDYADAVEAVEATLQRAFDGWSPASLVAFCNHPDPDVLFHEDGPCPPLDQEA